MSGSVDRERALARGVNAAAVAAFVVVAAMAMLLVRSAIWQGAPSGDEGLYSTTARLFADGQMPYIDFFFSPPPSMLAIYGTFYDVFGDRLLVGRAVSALFFGLALCLGSARVWKRSGVLGATVFVSLAALNLFVIHMSTLILTTAFEVFLLVAAWVAYREDRSAAGAAVTLAAAALLVSFRLSYAVALAVFWLDAAIRHRRSAASLLLITIVPAAVLLLTFGPALYAAGVDRPIFECFTYHFAIRNSASVPAEPLADRLTFLRLIARLFWPVLLAVVAALAMLRRGGERTSGWGLALLLAGVLTAAHLLPVVPFPKYQVATMIVLAVAAAETLGRIASGSAGSRLVLLLAVLLVAAGGTRSYGFIDHRAVMSPVEYPGAIVRQIHQVTGDQTVFTLDAALQFEGLRHVPGYSLDIFSVIGGVDAATAARYKLRTPRQLQEILETPGVDYAVLRTAHEFGVGDPYLKPLLDLVNREFGPALVFKHYGYASCDLILMRRKEKPTPPVP